MPTNLTTTADVDDLHMQKLSQDVRAAAQTKQRFRQFVRPETDFGPHMGDEYKFVKVGNIDEEARQIDETGDIPTGKLPIYAGLCSCDEYSLEVPYTSRASLISELSLESMIIKGLMDNAWKKLDKLAAVQFRQADLVYTPIGPMGAKNYALGTGGVAIDTASRPVTAYDLKNICGILRSRYNCPGYGGSNNYMMICTESTVRSLSDDPEYVEIAKRVDPQKLLNGEVDSFQNLRIICENNVLTDDLGNGCGECVIFGDDPVVEIEIYPLELQRALADSYGRVKGIRWTWYGGFKKTWNFATEGEVRIIRIHSL